MKLQMYSSPELLGAGGGNDIVYCDAMHCHCSNHVIVLIMLSLLVTLTLNRINHSYLNNSYFNKNAHPTAGRLKQERRLDRFGRCVVLVVVAPSPSLSLGPFCMHYSCNTPYNIIYPVLFTPHRSNIVFIRPRHHLSGVTGVIGRRRLF